MQRFGGGWTRILYRGSHKMSFNLDWNAYKNGFGNLGGDGWLGLEKIHRLTKDKPATLLISIYLRIITGIIHNTEGFRLEVKPPSINCTLGISLEMVVTLFHTATMPSLALMIKITTATPVIVLAHIVVESGWWYYSCAQGKLTGEPYADSTSNYYMKWPGISSSSMRYASMEIKHSDY